MAYINDDITATRRIYGELPLLTKEQEQEYGRIIQKDWVPFNGIRPTNPEDLKRWHRGNQARNRMIKHNMRFVIDRASKYLNRGVSFDDLIQEGAIGLGRAAEKFDPELGYKFSTYAYWWIRQAITRKLNEQGRSIRLPQHIMEKLNKIKKARRLLSQQLCRKPTNQEIADHLEWELPKLLEVLATEPHTLSLDSIREREDDDSGALVDFVIDEAADLTDLPDIDYMQSVIEKLFKGVTANSKEIYLLHHQGELSKKAIARQRGISPQAVDKAIRGAQSKINLRKVSLRKEVLEVLA